MRCFLMFLMLGAVGVSAQSVSKQLISSGGLTQSNGVNKLSWFYWIETWYNKTRMHFGV